MKSSKKNWDTVKWTPFEKATFGEPQNEQQAARMRYFHEHDIQLFLNSIYQVEIEESEMPAPFGKTIYLSFKTKDKQPRHDWREMQQIKNELV